MTSSMHTTEDEFEDFLNERLGGSDDDEDSKTIKTDAITATTATTNEKTVISAADNGVNEEEDELEKLLSESERDDEYLKQLAENNLAEERKEESNEVVLQFWDEKEQNVTNDDEEEEEVELNQKLSSILIPVPKTRKRSISKESMDQKQQNTETASNLSSSTASAVEDSSRINSNLSEVDARKQRILERQRQRQKLIQSLIESEEKNSILSKQLQARNQKLILVKQKWKKERKMFLDLLKVNDIELDLEIQKGLYNINELDVDDDYGDISSGLLIPPSQSALGAASGVLSSLISSFSQPVVQHPQTNEKAEESEPTKSTTEEAALDTSASVIDSFKGWIWGSSSTIGTTYTAVDQKSSAPKKASTSRK